MRRILVTTGVLGGGTALVFALAALTATLFPNGTVVSATWGVNTGVLRGVNVIAPGFAPGGAPFAGPMVNARGGGPMVIADDTVAGGMVTIQVDSAGEPVRDADGNPVIDSTGVQP